MSYVIAARPPTGAGPLFYSDVPSHYEELPPGELGTIRTLEVMAQLARDGARDPLLSRAARFIVGSTTGSPPRGVRAIRDFLGRHVLFTPDPVELELVQAPRLQIENITATGRAFGDCDDIATLGAALGLSAGFPARYVVLAFEPSGPWEHVYTELLASDGTWAELDTSREMQRIPPTFQPARVATFDV